jgi:hypothetical protein
MWAGTTFVRLVKGVAEASSSFLNLFFVWVSERWQEGKSPAVCGYPLSTLTRSLAAVAAAGWHAVGDYKGGKRDLRVGSWS